MATFTEQEIQEQLKGLDGWTTDGTAIEKRFEFDGFDKAMAFMAAAAPKIDALNHHPEWTNVYNRVDVRLTSHDAGGVTGRDLELAGVLDQIATAG
jgi:4a-hydroxytetrahydrobiopterin dehydratase